MKKRPLILITNDDGVHASGIRHLYQSLCDTADIVVVAPATEQSASGLSITIRHPLRIEKLNWSDTQGEIWSVNGTPADCVKIGLSVIMPQKPDLIVSGINRGSNAGRNVLYSGTVAAATEGVLQNIPSIALSMVDYFNPEYSIAKNYIPQLIDYTLQHPLPKGTLLNVNFPRNMSEQFKGLRFAKQGREYWLENPEEREHPAEGSAYYWLGAKLAKFDEDIHSDVKWLSEGYATAVPIHVSDLTHHGHFENAKDHFESFVNASAAITQH